MYNKKLFQPSELQLRQIKELIKTPWFVALTEWAEFEYTEWCKYGMSLIGQLDLLDTDDKSTMEKEYYATEAVNEWLDRVKKIDVPYIGESIKSNQE